MKEFFKKKPASTKTGPSRKDLKIYRGKMKSERKHLLRKAISKYCTALKGEDQDLRINPRLLKTKQLSGYYGHCLEIERQMEKAS